MELEQLTASKFADAIGVQRSSISHILSGRNKPSLELINKILEHFEQVNADWLLLGKGSMINDNNGAGSTTDLTFKEDPPNGTTGVIPKDVRPVKIVVFYSDNTFEEFISGH